MLEIELQVVIQEMIVDVFFNSKYAHLSEQLSWQEQETGNEAKKMKE